MANSTPTVISIMGPRMAQRMLRLSPFMAHLLRRGVVAGGAVIQQVGARQYQQNRPIHQHAREIPQIQRMQQKPDPQADQDRSRYGDLMTGTEVQQTGV